LRTHNAGTEIDWNNDPHNHFWKLYQIQMPMANDIFCAGKVSGVRRKGGMQNEKWWGEPEAKAEG
jgi:hypothetical protein